MMNVFRLLAITLGVSLPLFAQSPVNKPEDNLPGPDEVQKAIDEFNRLKREKDKNGNEVTVVLDPPALLESTDIAEENIFDPISEPETNQESNPENKIPEETPSPNVEITELPKPEDIEQINESHPKVRVQSIRKGTGKIEPENIKVRSTFPVKPLSQIPSGWTIVPNNSAPVFTQEVEIRPGTFISLDITPHVMIPQVDGLNSFAILEPGYESEKGYRQENTVSAVLEQSISQLDQDAIRIGNVLSDMNRLLTSLPKQETEKQETDKP
ncbi:MAG: hypothetical protein AB8D78_03070 [Akkermansiaceae bacterium]